MKKADKHIYRENASKELLGSTVLIIAEYRGLKMEELTKLRSELKKHGASFEVCKNRLFKKAIENEAQVYATLKDRFTGPIGVVKSTGDSAQATKVALEFEKDHEKFVVKAGFLDSSVLSPKDLKLISDLPSKEVLLTKMLGSILAPHRGLVTVLSGVPRQLVQVINAIKDKKS